jgi:hypothetical protein
VSRRYRPPSATSIDESRYRPELPLPGCVIDLVANDSFIDGCRRYPFMLQELVCSYAIATSLESNNDREQEVTMKWAGMYLVGFIILLGGILAALWKLGILANIGTTWTVIGVVILIGFGVMIAVSNSGAKENIQVDRS